LKRCLHGTAKMQRLPKKTFKPNEKKACVTASPKLHVLIALLTVFTSLVNLGLLAKQTLPML
jgi:hypothetical protein